jgi:serine/threonine-protein kinase
VNLKQNDDNHDRRLAELVTSLVDRMCQGEVLELENVCRDHPEFAIDLRELWGTVAVTQAVASDRRSRPQTAEAIGPGFDLPFRMGDFILQKEIGRGGMGIVYRATRMSTNEFVAFKLMLQGELASPSDRERFKAEASAASRLQHPHIVPIYEIGEHHGRLFFAMKLIEGRTLAQCLNEGPISSDKAARLLLQVARAIQYAHDQGVLHRDLKPSNILIDEHEQVYLCDFGLAKEVSGTAGLTKTGAVLGTPAYMAPEQAAGARGQVGPLIDVYSIGAILYHAMTGRPPFQGASPVDTVLMVLEQDPIPPRMLNRRANRLLEMIAMRCLQKPTNLRYASAGLLADDLEAFLNNDPVSAAGGRFWQIINGVFRETHHASILQNWGLLWIWHSLVLLVASFATNVIFLMGVSNRLVYQLTWGAGFTAWAIVFWSLRRQLGPVTFVERQIAHVWGASLIGVILLFPFEGYLGLELMRLAPVLAVVAAMTFLVKAGILSGTFYWQVVALMLTAVVMALEYRYALFIFGLVSALCFFVPGLKYHRQRLRLGESGLDVREDERL